MRGGPRCELIVSGFSPNSPLTRTLSLQQTFRTVDQGQLFPFL